MLAKSGWLVNCFFFLGVARFLIPVKIRLILAFISLGFQNGFQGISKINFMTFGEKELINMLNRLFLELNAYFSVRQ